MLLFVHHVSITPSQDMYKVFESKVLCGYKARPIIVALLFNKIINKLIKIIKKSYILTLYKFDLNNNLKKIKNYNFSHSTLFFKIKETTYT